MNISHINFRYSDVNVINDLSMEIPENKIISVVGKKHSGKSALFKIIARKEKPQSGSIFFFDTDIVSIKEPDFNTYEPPEEIQERAKFLSRLSSNLVCINQYLDLFKEMTVRENFKMASYRMSDKKLFSKNLNLISDLVPCVREKFKTKVKFLSNTEKMIVAISTAIISIPKLVVINEPMCNFSYEFKNTISNLIKKLNKELSVSFLLMQSELMDALRISDWIYEIHDGEIVKEGDAASFQKFDVSHT